jgi:hypothetical protein
MLQAEDEEYQEAGILVLGCISEEDNGYESIEQHLDHLVPFLIAKLDAQNTEVLATTCWTLSKFSEWVSQTEQAPPQRL